jgi:transposase
MPLVKRIEVKEGLAELKRLHKTVAVHVKPRLQMLILSVQKDLHSKYALSDALGVDPNSIYSWKTAYQQGGLPALLLDKRGGKKKPLIDENTASAIAQKLADPYAAPRSFTELQAWVDEYYLPGINYHTLRKHVKTKHGAKLKVVRKSHAQKDEAQVAAFKKK